MNITRFWKFTISQGLLVKFRETEEEHNEIIDFSVLKFSTYNRILRCNIIMQDEYLIAFLYRNWTETEIAHKFH